jgi:hypothetical protein
MVFYDTKVYFRDDTMSTLQEQLDRLIQRKGEQDPLVQILRNQITAKKSDKTFQDLYLTGSVKKAAKPERARPCSRSA